VSKPELGRGERVLPGLFRLRLPLPWPGVPHVNAWAIRAGDGLVLVDSGLHRPDSLEQLEYAMAQVGLGLDQVTQLVITHAHEDHWGQAATVLGRTGAPLWMHPNFEHARRTDADPAAAAAHRFEIGRQSGVPEPALRAFLERFADMPTGVAGVVEPDHELVNGVSIATDLGPLHVHETPGHAPSHVCLFAPEHRLLISGDHLLGRVSLYFDFGWTPDPVAEFLTGLSTLASLDARLCVAGHGRPFTDVEAHIRANRELIADRLRATRAGLVDMPLTALELAPAIFGEPLTPVTATWRLPETLSYLTHLQRIGEATSERDAAGEVERWRAV
jgi:glyoxylase-like metal-dependent hydrolase (beta-lactamase superfamily II)